LYTRCNPNIIVAAILFHISGPDVLIYRDMIMTVERTPGLGQHHVQSRDRCHPSDLRTGEALDFRRVEEYIPKKKLLLRAGVKIYDIK